MLADLYTKMEQVISKYATENGFSLILNVGQENTPVLWVSNQVEITQAIIEAYDKAAPVAPKANAPAKPAAAPGAVRPPPQRCRPPSRRRRARQIAGRDEDVSALASADDRTGGLRDQTRLLRISTS